MVSLPKAMRIGSFVVKIKEVADVDATAPALKEGKAYAAYNDKDLLIEVDKTMVPKQKASSVVHEALHCGFGQAGLHMDFNANQEEHFIRRIEPYVYSIIRDNPAFVKYIQQS